MNSLLGRGFYRVRAGEVKKFTSRDRVALEKIAYQERPEPDCRTYGTRTTREFLNLIARVEKANGKS